MNRKEQIEFLKETCEEQLQEMQKLYEKSIEEQEYNYKISVLAKNYLENLNSILDFTAHEILEKYCMSTKNNSTFFPVLSKQLEDKKIESTLNGLFPNLKTLKPTLFEKLKSLQPKFTPDNSLLLDFKTLCNNNKHQLLTPQVRKDEVVNLITVGGGQTIVWTDEGVTFQDQQFTLDPGAKCQFTVQLQYASDNKRFLSGFGWIVEELVDYIPASKPKTDHLPENSFKLHSYKVGSFHFSGDNSKTFSFAMLGLYGSKVFSISDDVFDFIKTLGRI